MDVGTWKVVVANSQQNIEVLDLRRAGIALDHEKDSGMKHQLRSIKLFPDESAFVVSSVEGRVAVEYLDKSEASQSKNYAFKCHRGKRDGTNLAFPVNALAFHPKYGTFATGGSDGNVFIWDGINKKRITAFPTYQSSISSVDFNAEGSLMAIAVSYGFEQGEIEHSPDAIHIRYVAESDVLPKHMR